MIVIRNFVIDMFYEKNFKYFMILDIVLLLIKLRTTNSHKSDFISLF